MSGLGIFQCVADRIGADVCDPKVARQLRSIVKSVLAEAEQITCRKMCAQANIVECVAPPDFGNILKLKNCPLIRIHKVECLMCNQELKDVCIDSIEKARLQRCCGWCRCSCGPSHPITGQSLPGHLKRSIRVTYDAGYVTEEQSRDPNSAFHRLPVTMPADLEETLCQIAQSRWDFQCQPTNVQAMSNLGASVTFRTDGDFPEHLRIKLMRHAVHCI